MKANNIEVMGCGNRNGGGCGGMPIVMEFNNINAPTRSQITKTEQRLKAVK